jgi:hypothetical protein
MVFMHYPKELPPKQCNFFCKFLIIDEFLSLGMDLSFGNCSGCVTKKKKKLRFLVLYGS